MNPDCWTREVVAEMLRDEDAAALQQLWRIADGVRHEQVGDEVHLRGLIEISNHCIRECHYCGLRSHNRKIPRYRMSSREVLMAVKSAKEFGYGTVVLQSGEDPGWNAEDIETLIGMIKWETGLAVTLSLGERSAQEYARWREAGADRVLLRFETSDRELYQRIHPARKKNPVDRMNHLRVLRELGYEVGSGVMVGIPGQTFESLADDILLFRDLDFDMIGLGPYIPNPDTPLGSETDPSRTSANQVPATLGMTFKVLALTRLVRPDANIPSTSALAAIDPVEGHRVALSRGANVIMPNLTPLQYRSSYLIYPGKAYVDEASRDVHESLLAMFNELGRCMGVGTGARVRPSVTV